MILQTDENFWDIPDEKLIDLIARFYSDPNSVKFSDYGKEVECLYIGGFPHVKRAQLLEEAYQKKYGKENSHYKYPSGYYKGQLLWFYGSAGMYLACELIRVIPADNLIEIRLLGQGNNENMKVVRGRLYEKHISLE